jgi:hypothetical protein
MNNRSRRGFGHARCSGGRDAQLPPAHLRSATQPISESLSLALVLALLAPSKTSQDDEVRRVWSACYASVMSAGATRVKPPSPTMQPRVSVLISSFDGYSECWPAVCHGLSKYWLDCPYPTYLIANKRDFSHPRVSVLRSADADDWSGALLFALARLDTEYVMYLQEDYWLVERVSTDRIREYVDLMDVHGINYIRLLSKPIPDGEFAADRRLGVLAKTADYRTSVQVSLWRTQVFRSLLRAGESAWQFEIDGNRRSISYGATFLSVKRHDRDDYFNGVRYLCSAINRGKWSRAAVDYARREGLQIDFSLRPVETWWDEVKRTKCGRFTSLWAHRLHLVAYQPAVALLKVRRRLGI